MKTPQSIYLLYGALFMVCLIWLVTSVFYLGQPLPGLFFLCILGAILFLRFQEQGPVKDLVDGLQKKIKRLESKAWYYESIVTNSKDIIFTTDNEHRIIKFNKGSEQTFGVMAWEVLGKHVSHLFEDSEQINHLLAELVNIGHAKAVELMVKNRETQEEHWLSIGVSKLYDPLITDKELSEQQSLFAGEIFTCKNVTHRRILEQELKEKNEQLIRLSITDSLTSLYNVRHLKGEIQRLHTVINRFPERPLTLALMDVDKFKEYNDQLGHLAGDNLLMVLSDIIQTQIRKNLDSAYRYGGDEFVLLLPDTDWKGAKVICDRILTEFLSQRLGATSLSIGVAQFDREWGPLSASLMVSKADEAMYMVKVRGGRGLHVYDQPLPDDLADRVPLDTQKIPR